MKKRMLLITMLMVAVLASGCAKVVSSREYTAPVIIVGTYHRDAWTQLVWTGNSYMTIRHSEVDRVTVKSEDDVSYQLYGQNVYHLCHGRNGEYMTGHFTKIVHENGDVNIYLNEISELTSDLG